ncbi:hypothetical protein [Paenibacillus sp. OK003]|uniref:hypothetical protein n=1 Tax=Paenibacillus sp. OK003 TaxID=1884380 RepID=UPI0008BAE19B|nr:hypothetical protein [Paenibacillus sp. OK003]SEK96436.1 hypothetical protein SAMN05518856_106202 [Paenibacillus sp. OK003]
MTAVIAKLFILGILSLWAGIYIGSLAPTLWKQKNYRGAAGTAILAGLTMVLPVVFTLIRNN